MERRSNVANPMHRLNLQAKAEYDLWRAEAALADAMQTIQSLGVENRLLVSARENVRTTLDRLGVR